MPESVRSHTSTNEWQSFEMRMRRRRAERCVLRAEVALEAGFEDDAKAALAEAGRLDSSSPEFATLQKRVNDRRAAEVAAARVERRRKLLRTAAAITLVGGSGILGIAGLTGRDDRSIAEVRGPQATLQAAAPTVPAPISGRVERDAPPARESKTVVPKPADDNARPGQNGGPEKLLPLVAPVPSRSAPAAAVPKPPEVPPQRPVLSPPSLGVAAFTALEVGEPAPTAPPMIESTATEEAEPAVRAALARYESAYTSLNASAAQAVWPTVDERSLARAFDSLESQRLSLGRCSVSVNGAAASASCNGTTTWTPKVGGGTRTEPRQWRFELLNTGGSWQIVRADARQ